MADTGATGSGLVLDAASRSPVAQVVVQLIDPAAGVPVAVTFTDSSGRFQFELVPSAAAGGTFLLRLEALGYESQQVEARPATAQPLTVLLRPRPLLMDELTVQARRTGADIGTAAFVEVVPVERGGGGVDLPLILDQAVGVKTRRYGGLGSFSTVSIRGSTAEQVQVFLDGVSLNQAMGGGVDLGTLPAGGIEQVEVYRGAVPARFGGNALGGVVHIRTRTASGERTLKARAAAGSFGSREFSASAGGRLGRTRYLGLVDFGESGNDFRFLDDNGTAFNPDDDEWVRRLNNDFRSLRTLGKVDHEMGSLRLQGQNVVDVTHRGIPGIGNLQAEGVRFDTWRSTSELQLFGIRGPVGYRLVAHHVLQQEEYKDLNGEVGLGVQHERNTTASVGLRLEANFLLARALTTGFARLGEEDFRPENLLRPQSRLLDSTRRTLTVGGEVELPLANDRLRVTAGGQGQRIDDQLLGPHAFLATRQDTVRDRAASHWGGRLGATWQVGKEWTLKGHGGRYSRPPSFFELFGDRGAVIGNADLAGEGGVNLDLGLVHRPVPRTGGVVRLFELVVFRRTARNLIRFVHNSQLVTRPDNLGRARIDGVELRSRLRLGRRARLDASYAYQVPRNRSTLSYERDKDLPNAPRHGLDVRVEAGASAHRLHYELNLEGSHYLDRANLRSVPRRIVHGVGGRTQLGPRRGANTEVFLEVRNLTANQVADLWGYPLPGRSYFVAIQQDIGATWAP